MARRHFRPHRRRGSGGDPLSVDETWKKGRWKNDVEEEEALGGASAVVWVDGWCGRGGLSSPLPLSTAATHQRMRTKKKTMMHSIRPFRFRPPKRRKTTKRRMSPPSRRDGSGNGAHAAAFAHDPSEGETVLWFRPLHAFVEDLTTSFHGVYRERGAFGEGWRFESGCPRLAASVRRLLLPAGVWKCSRSLPMPTRGERKAAR